MIHKKKLKDNLIKIITFCCILVLAQLSIWHGGISDFISGGMLSLWNKAQVLSIFVIIYLYMKKKVSPSKFTAVMLFIRMWLIYVTYANGQPIDTVDLFRYCALVLLIDLYRNEIDKIVGPIMLIFEFLVYYNLYTCIVTGSDIYGAFYGSIGYDNDFTIYFIVAYFWSLMYMKIKRKRFRPILMIVIIHITLVYTWVTTGLVAVLATDILLIVCKFRPFKLSLFKSYMIYVCIEILLIFVRIQNLFEFIVVSLLGKDLTFSGRTSDWDNAIEIVGQSITSFLFGHGILTQEAEKVILGDVYCHNSLLEQLFRGGIIYVVLFLVMIYFLSRKSENGIDTYKCIQALIFCICSLWIAGFAESLFERYIACILFCGLYAVARPQIPKEQANNQRKL